MPPLAPLCFLQTTPGRIRSPARMMFAVQPLQPLAGDVSIYLGGRKITMSKQQLHNPEVSAVIEQVRREGMPEHVRGDRLRNTGNLRVLANGMPKRLARHPRFAGGYKYPRAISVLHQVRPGFLQITLHP